MNTDRMRRYVMRRRASESPAWLRGESMATVETFRRATAELARIVRESEQRRAARP